MFSRITLSLILMVAVLVAPAASIDIAKAFSSHTKCCARVQMDVDPCQRCPVNPNQTNSNSACCSVQSPCFVYYSDGADDFVVGMTSIAFKSLTNDRLTFRVQRPLVPPPRIAFS
jgi:hypothetical protein